MFWVCVCVWKLNVYVSVFFFSVLDTVHHCIGSLYCPLQVPIKSLRSPSMRCHSCDVKSTQHLSSDPHDSKKLISSPLSPQRTGAEVLAPDHDGAGDAHLGQWSQPFLIAETRAGPGLPEQAASLLQLPLRLLPRPSAHRGAGGGRDGCLRCSLLNCIIGLKLLENFLKLLTLKDGCTLTTDYQKGAKARIWHEATYIYLYVDKHIHC